MKSLQRLLLMPCLAPLLAVLSQLLLRLAGKPVLADQDILFFMLQPAGLICMVTLGAFWLSIIILGQAALMAILAATNGSVSNGESDTEKMSD